jgi:DNA-binding MarR family transcriptional regulator
VVPDHVDEVLAQWKRERPDVDVSAMAIIGRLSRLDKAIGRRLDTVFSEHDLESWEFDVLATLLRTGAPHQLTPGQLLDAVMITSGAMTNRLDRLEKRGFVERVKSPDDGRQVLVTLTDVGLATVDAALIDHAANELQLIGILDKSQHRHLVELLRIMDQGLALDSQE